MDRIEVAVIEHTHYSAALSSLACDITQRPIENMDDLISRLNKFKDRPLRKAIKFCGEATHSTPLELNNYVVAIVGASRRFLAQIRTYRVGITFVSGSLQYQDVRTTASFTEPYAILNGSDEVKAIYKDTYDAALENYARLIELGIPHDDAAYANVQGLRNVVLISGNAQTFKHIINQRACSRNTVETEYTVLRMWQALLKTKDGELFFGDAGPACMRTGCDQGKMTCGQPYDKGSKTTYAFIEDFIATKWPLLSGVKGAEPRCL